MKSLGFTGTRKGMTDAQKNAVKFLIRWIAPDEVHHGVCVGSDEEFDALCKELEIKRVGHPPDKTDYLAKCDCEEMREPKPYLHRDRDIVFDCEFMIATPKESAWPEKVGRGQGTWYTANVARMMDRRLWVVYPNGEVDEPEGIDTD